MLNNNFIIGGDPEFFCKDFSNNHYISLIPYIKGTKKKPQKINIIGCSHLRDGVSIELNLPPVPEFWMLHSIIQQCIDYTNSWLKEVNPNYKLDITSSAIFNPEELNHKEARTFGCDPAYNTYTLLEVYRPEPSSLFGLRTASYHIHYGWDTTIPVTELRKFIFLNDLFLGFPAMFIDESDNERKTVYGSLGEHRIKYNDLLYNEITESDRIEYRSLGAGIHLYPDFISTGIDLIKEHISNVDDLFKLYGKDLEILSMNHLNSNIITNLKTKLINNGHFNR